MIPFSYIFWFDLVFQLLSQPTTAQPTNAPTTAQPTSNPTSAAPTNEVRIFFHFSKIQFLYLLTHMIECFLMTQPTPGPTTAQPTNAPTTAQPTAIPTLPPTPAPTNEVKKISYMSIIYDYTCELLTHTILCFVQYSRPQLPHPIQLAQRPQLTQHFHLPQHQLMR